MTDRRPPGRARWPELLLLLLLLGICVMFAPRYFRVGFFDDSFITFRYARNWAQGSGLSWNAGEGPLEGFTSLGWVLLLGVGHRLTGLEIPLLAVRLGVMAGVLCLVASWAFLKRVLGASGPRWAPLLAAAQLVLTPEFLRHTQSGMETILSALALSACALYWCWQPLEQLTRKQWVLGGMLVGAAMLARPDATLFGLAMGGYLAFRAGGFRLARSTWLPFLLGFCAPIFALIIFRRAYFAEWLPLPAYMKLRPGALLQPGPVGFILGHWLGFLGIVAGNLMVFFLGLAVSPKPVDARVPAAVFGAAVYASYFLTVLPIMSLNYRYLIPTPPILCVAGAWGLARFAAWVTEQLPAPRAGLGWLAAVAALLLTQGLGRFPVVKRESTSWFKTHEPFASLGRVLMPFPSLSVAATEVGELSWYSKASVIDLAGLNDRFIAKRRFTSPNLAREFEAYMLAKQPDVYVDPSGEYGYAEMKRHPALERGYELVQRGKLRVFVRRSYPERSALVAALLAP